jgi:carbonic anhydrase
VKKTADFLSAPARHRTPENKMLSTILVATLLSTTVLACPGLDGHHSSMYKRGESTATPWDYNNAVTWGGLEDKYSACTQGTHQSPIALRTDQGLATWHQPIFKNYNQNVTGVFGSWGFGPQFALNYPDQKETLPQLTFEEAGNQTTLYLREWHVHTPAEHIVDGHQSRAELHLVHYEGEDQEHMKPRAVISIRIDPGTDENPFFKRLSPFIGFKDLATKVSVQESNPGTLLQQIGNLKRYFTYSGMFANHACY